MGRKGWIFLFILSLWILIPQCGFVAQVFCVEAYVKTKSVTGFGEKTLNFCQHDHDSVTPATIYKNPSSPKKN